MDDYNFQKGVTKSFIFYFTVSLKQFSCLFDTEILSVCYSLRPEDGIIFVTD